MAAYEGSSGAKDVIWHHDEVGNDEGLHLGVVADSENIICSSSRLDIDMGECQSQIFESACYVGGRARAGALTNHNAANLR